MAVQLIPAQLDTLSHLDRSFCWAAVDVPAQLIAGACVKTVKPLHNVSKPSARTGRTITLTVSKNSNTGNTDRIRITTEDEIKQSPRGGGNEKNGGRKKIPDYARLVSSLSLQLCIIHTKFTDSCWLQPPLAFYEISPGVNVQLILPTTPM
ncbi:hypothetical protein Bbelb_185710 [Branchiostoma belcheri]|nr:hypothetical protein Bbelb_185710 [Branchiostoma belcheri]